MFSCFISKNAINLPNMKAPTITHGSIFYCYRSPEFSSGQVQRFPLSCGGFDPFCICLLDIQIFFRKTFLHISFHRKYRQTNVKACILNQDKIFLITRDIDLSEWFVLLQMMYEFSCKSSQRIPSIVNIILSTSALAELQREYK